MTNLKAASNVLISKFGSDIEYQTPVGTTVDKRGNEDFTWGTATSTSAIVDSPNVEKLNWEEHGGMESGTIYFYMKDDETIQIGDRVTYNTNNYRVRGVDKYEFLNSYTCLRVNSYKE